MITKSGRKGVAKISSSFTLMKAPIYDDIEYSKDSKKITLKNNGKRPRFIELDYFFISIVTFCAKHIKCYGDINTFCRIDSILNQY